MPHANPRANEGSGPEKSEVNTASASRERLLLVARGHPVGGTHAPIRRRLRRPGETRITNEMHERPLRIIRMVGCNPQLAAGLQDPRNLVEGPCLDEPPLVVPDLRPGIREQDKHDRKAGISQALKDLTRIIRMNPHIRQAMGAHLRQQLGDPVLEGLAADEAGVRMKPRLRGKVFATAKPDLKRMRPGVRKQVAKVDGTVGEANAWQQVADEPLLQRAERSALAPAMEFAAPPSGIRQANRLFSCATRSVRSHEKPPSASAARPKCP